MEIFRVMRALLFLRLVAASQGEEAAANLGLTLEKHTPEEELAALGSETVALSFSPEFLACFKAQSFELSSFTAGHTPHPFEEAEVLDPEVSTAGDNF